MNIPSTVLRAALLGALGLFPGAPAWGSGRESDSLQVDLGEDVPSPAEQAGFQGIRSACLEDVAMGRLLLDTARARAAAELRAPIQALDAQVAALREAVEALEAAVAGGSRAAMEAAGEAARSCQEQTGTAIGTFDGQLARVLRDRRARAE